MHPATRYSRIAATGRAALALLVALAGSVVPAAAQTSDSSRLLVYINSAAVGSEESSLKKTPEGWQITGNGRLAPPLDLTTRRLVIRYSDDWKPIELLIDATSRGAAFSLKTTFTGTTADSDIVQAGQPTRKTDIVAADTIVIPNLFFASYEALAMRLAKMTAETADLSGYVAPQAQIALDARRLDVQTIETGSGTVRAHRYAVGFHNPGATLPSEIWTDDAGRLLRFEVPSQGLVVLREDISSVTARRQNISRAGDQSVTIPANGFNLAGTVSQPKGSPDAKGRFPAIVMVGGSGPTDRDETVYGIPVFGQLAGALADAGYLVVRYDKRGVGQSGGRGETAGLADYADDALAAFAYVRERKDVDGDRVAMLGHSEGAWVALMAAAREKDIAALVLVAGASGTGADLILEQQKAVLEKMSLTDAEKQARIAMQTRIQAAVLGQGDWKDVPADLRQQADTVWFRSFLAFSPTPVIAKVRQPILIVQGELDTQVPPRHADALVQLARARKKVPADDSQVVNIPGINHLLVPATTGDVSEYPSLAGKNVSPEVPKAVTTFLDAKMPKGKD